MHKDNTSKGLSVRFFYISYYYHQDKIMKPTTGEKLTFCYDGRSIRGCRQRHPELVRVERDLEVLWLRIALIPEYFAPNSHYCLRLSNTLSLLCGTDYALWCELIHRVM